MGGDRIPGPLNDAVDEETRRLRELAGGHLDDEESMKRMRDVLARARDSWIHEFGRLDEIAVDVYHGHRGGFIRKFADAWHHADAFDKRLIQRAWEAIILKYGLEEDPEGTGKPLEPLEEAPE